MQLIRLRDALQQMDSSDGPFSLTFITADRKRKTGGEIIRIEGCHTTGRKHKPGNALATAGRRQPGHYGNGTRNLVLENGQTRKVHVWLIIQYNGKTVI